MTVLGHALRTHKFQVGQTVFYTSSPITRPGASGSYKVVRLLPSDGDDPEAVEMARMRWTEAKTNGAEVTYWKADENGRWQRQMGE